jgi:hypothetical protein
VTTDAPPDARRRALLDRIDVLVDAIARDYPSGLVDDLRRHWPEHWQRINTLDTGLGVALVMGDLDQAEKALDAYAAAWRDAMEWSRSNERRRTG